VCDFNYFTTRIFFFFFFRKWWRKIHPNFEGGREEESETLELEDARRSSARERNTEDDETST